MDFFRGGFCLSDFALQISSAADFFRGEFLRGGFLPRRISSAASGGHLSFNYTSDVIGVICRIWGAVIQLAMPPWLCFKCLFTLPVSCVMFQKSVKTSTPNFRTPSRDNKHGCRDHGHDGCSPDAASRRVAYTASKLFGCS